MTTAADRQLEEFFEREWQATLKNAPEFATFLGEHQYNDQLSDLSESALLEDNNRKEGLISELKQIDFSQLSKVNKLNYELYLNKLENELQEFDYKGHLMPLNVMSGVQGDFARIIQMMPFNNQKDFENYLARLQAFPTYIDQHIALLEKGMADGYTVPKPAIASIPSQIQGQLPEDFKQSLYYQVIEKSQFKPSDSLKNKIEEAIQNCVYPAFLKLKKFVEESYIPACRDSYGLSEIPNGKEYYNLKLREYTTTQLTAEEIHEIGLREVERIYQEKLDLVKSIGFEGSYEDFLENLRTNPDFYFTDEETLLIHYRDIAKRIDKELPRFFKVLPRLPYGVEPIPAHQAPSYPTAYYMPPDMGMTRAGIFYANTSQLDTRPKYEMECLTLHEGVPGHHLQIALALELDNLPKFRRLAMSNVTGYIEGWGLYSESLGEEMGFYKDPYSKFGQLSFEMWRACRLVIDTGIHAFQWDRQKAVDYLHKYTGKSVQACTVEVDRYISIPGQATSYKIGKLKILELRRKFEKSRGDKADLREFHDIILRNGAIPLTILEEHFEEYLAEG